MDEGVKPKLVQESNRVSAIVNLFEGKDIQNEGLTNVTNEDSCQEKNEDENIEENYYEYVDAMTESLGIRREKLEDNYKIVRTIELNPVGTPLEASANENVVGHEEHYKTVKKVYSDGNDKPKEVTRDEKNDVQFGKTVGTENDSAMEEIQEEEIQKEVNESNGDQDIYSAVEAEVSSSPKEIEDDIYLEVEKEFDPREDQKTMLSFDHQWFWGDVERSKVESVLNKSLEREGTFIVRETKRGGDDSPYAISVVHSKEIFHILVRKRVDGKMAVGKPKFGEKKFATLQQLIEFYQNNDLTLHDSQGDVMGVVQLGEFPEKDF